MSKSKSQPRKPIKKASGKTAPKLKVGGAISSQPKPAKQAKPSKASGKSTSGKVTSPVKSAPIAATAAPPSVLRQIFEGAGFKHVIADNIHFAVDGRNGEIDHIFVWENVVLLCEETAEASATKHCTNKLVFHGKIASDYQAFRDVYWPLNPALDDAIGPGYSLQDIEFRHIYYSEKSDVDSSIGSSDPLIILTRSQATYFHSLVDTIQRSARYELLKYLGVALNQVGSARVSGSGVASNSFAAFALPAAHTSYPAGFTVVSFYADPMALIQRSYVLRRDGWEDPDLSYQRFVRAEKLDAMRDYLSANGKVFINNLVVTLPSTALLLDANSAPVVPGALASKSQVTLQLPLELGTVGIVDGQHRVFSYYEGGGDGEKEITKIRQRQNLLVTGIIFPPHYTAEMRVKFEAEIFLGINNNQSPVNTQLKQDLETIINPETPLAISRSIVKRLSTEGPLAGMMQMSQFDPSDRIASGSLGPYVVTILAKKTSALYKTWDGAGKRDLTDPSDRAAYVDYCVSELRSLLGAAAKHLKGKFRSVPNGGVLSTTVVGGLILLLDRMVKDGTSPSAIDYSQRLKGIEKFDFSRFTGSAWGKLANELYSAL